MTGTWKKIVLIIFLLLLISIPVIGIQFLPDHASSQLITIYIGDELQNIPLDMGVPYLDLKTEKIMVPIRYLSETLGWDVKYLDGIDTTKQGFQISNGVREATMYVGKPEVFFKTEYGEGSKVLDAVCEIYNGRSYVPIRFIAETMNYKVSWERYGVEDFVFISGEALNFPQEEMPELPNYVEEKPLDPSYEEYEVNDLVIKGKFIGDNEHFANLVNSYRVGKNLTHAHEDEALEKLAQTRALECAYKLISTGQADHSRLDGSRLHAGENLQYGPKAAYRKIGGYTDDIAFREWIKSDSHRKNLETKMEGQYILGVAHFEFDLRGRTYVVGVMNFREEPLVEDKL